MASSAAVTPSMRFAIACIGHAFSAAPHIAIREFRNHDGGLRLGAAADRKRAKDRPALDGEGEVQGRVHGGIQGPVQLAVSNASAKPSTGSYGWVKYELGPQ